MYKSIAEIDHAYAQHLNSLKLSGLEFNEQEVYKAWADAVKTFKEENGA